MPRYVNLSEPDSSPLKWLYYHHRHLTSHWVNVNSKMVTDAVCLEAVRASHPILVKLPFWTQDQTLRFLPVNIHLIRVSLLFWLLESLRLSVLLSSLFTILSSCASFINAGSMPISLHPSLCLMYNVLKKGWTARQSSSLD